MKTNPEALNAIIEALNGTPVETGKTIDALNEISNALGGQTGAEKLPDAIENIAAVASSGGGGSSDFSTATVTVTNLPSELYAPCTKDNEYFNGSDFTITTDGTFTVILYKGKAIAEAPNEDFTVSGDIEVDGTDMIITGDGTITFS